MVATRLSDVAGKGWGWYSGTPAEGSSRHQQQSGTSPNQPLPGSDLGTSSSAAAASSSSSSPPSSSAGNSYWNVAQESIQTVAEQTYSSVSGAVSSMYHSGPNFSIITGRTGSEGSLGMGVDDESGLSSLENLQNGPNRRRGSILTSPTLLTMFNNPYVGVRGGRQFEATPPSSLQAVRSLLRVVPTSDVMPEFVSEEASSNAESLEGSGKIPWDSNTSDKFGQNQHPEAISSTSETASQLAEGTLRAFRDVALDEAVELHSALRYWSYRWQRPVLSWLEAGPTVWFSEDGYRHEDVGKRVAQIQAVLARRCAAIGDLQQHLLRAGWQRGVAQWGVLGEGGEWATVAGFDGSMPVEAGDDVDLPPSPMRRVHSGFIDNIESSAPPELPRQAPTSNVSNLPQHSHHNTLYYTNVSVKMDHNGRIFIDNPALAEWSVDAMLIVRRQLYRAANGLVVLPFADNWSGDEEIPSTLDPAVEKAGTLPNLTGPDGTTTTSNLPVWASIKTSHATPISQPLHEEEEEDDVEDENVTKETSSDDNRHVIISDLPLMVSEISELLDVMEPVMGLQRARRLDKLKAPSWLRRNWYFMAASSPVVSYLVYKMLHSGFGPLRRAANMFRDFFREHVIGPISAMYDELTRGTEDISDRQARNIAIESLQKMIRSWLDETYPEMPVKERSRLAQAMDVSLIEMKKEESMKTIYELNNVVRMSLIEAQFIKKEMMNAMLALDEMQKSTNFNMNMAAVTPFLLLMYATKRAFQFVFYAILKMGKSREETYSSFLQILVDVERLLVMRDNPPSPPMGSRSVRKKDGESSEVVPPTSSLVVSGSGGESVLSADDLGMLMLHIHELRTILWRDRRRFSQDTIRSVAEDLAELAGERGAVSVRQQIQIITRMCRTYPFLKVVSSGMIFQYINRG